MRKILIFCEGITDQIFIADCIELFYKIQCKRIINKKGVQISFNDDSLIIDVGGCSKLSDPIYYSMLEDNTECGGGNVVIFDADISGTGNGNNGFNSCVQKLESIKTSRKIKFDYYIWPNHQEDGIIENLLRKLIPPEKESIFNCIEGHKDCLSNLGHENLRLAEIKEEIGFYLYTSSVVSEARNRDYKDPAIWNININEIIELKKFKDFLDSYFVGITSIEAK